VTDQRSASIGSSVYRSYTDGQKNVDEFLDNHQTEDREEPAIAGDERPEQRLPSLSNTGGQNPPDFVRQYYYDRP